MMQFQDLQKLGGVITRTLFKRDITLKFKPLKPESEWAEAGNPEHQDQEVEQVWTVYIRKASAADSMEIIGATNRDRLFVAMYLCVCNEDGSAFFPNLAEACAVEAWVWVPLYEAIKSINPETQKKSQPRTRSGAKSRSLSAEGQSASGKNRSPLKKRRSGSSTARNGGR